MAPIIEEIFWRGYVQGVLERTISRSIAVFGQAFLFALLHMVGIAGRFRVFVIGLILGFWRCRKRTLIPLIVAHMVYNSLFYVQILCNYFEERTVKVTHDYRKQLENLCRIIASNWRIFADPSIIFPRRMPCLTICERSSCLLNRLIRDLVR
ncbi:MAG: CPBP family intramembrane metalloprotease [Deltaproteobacteria bacterium]|nr:CPBP family intramembrane metalloprotease [Deltaproteobacteria bacterium]